MSRASATSGSRSTASEQKWEVFRHRRHATEKTLLKAAFNEQSQEGDGSENQKEAAEKRWSVPLEQLAREWLDEYCVDSESKIYVVEKLLPTLVLSLEKLLTEVSRQFRGRGCKAFVNVCCKSRRLKQVLCQLASPISDLSYMPQCSC